ncbi:MAG TPA: bifunctional DNA-formamidopyrimidine glycosylase/DNA-(apurinic or apyrimidinic site) lyase [Candidatus Acidoferrales bacterium]|nr:bifunctional DNA-formamidopyrimidine glycosylase/DNA-(apurinic or apyrimidinic site) lyase [Candidatus Acidoferrales bacterium]
MPELPEVETIVRDLQSVLPERSVVSVQLGKTDFIEDPGALGRELPGCRIASVRRHGKMIVIAFDRQTSMGESKAQAQGSLLLIHLGMTGQLRVNFPASPLPPHTHVRILLDDGHEIRYTDIRRFGSIGIIPVSRREENLGLLGADPLEASVDVFTGRIAGRRARVKALLLDQHVLRGIGNIYADESLWRARLHPTRLASGLRRDEATRLYKAVQKTLREAIRLRGSSISDYVDANGEEGEFQLRHRVYQREGKKCFRCGALIRRMIVAGRSSYFCPRCQPTPRLRRVKKGIQAREVRRMNQRNKYMSSAPAALNIAP